MSKLVLRRITAPKYPRDLSGRGAEINGGRWNPKGRPALYTAESASAATIEWFVHRTPLDKLFIPAVRLMTLEVDLPADDLSMRTVDRSSLPADLLGAPGAAKCRLLGERWLEANGELILKAPSANASVDPIYVLNPRHPHFVARVRIVEEVDYAPAARLSIAYDLSVSQTIAINDAIVSGA